MAANNIKVEGKCVVLAEMDQVSAIGKTICGGRKTCRGKFRFSENGVDSSSSRTYNRTMENEKVHQITRARTRFALSPDSNGSSLVSLIIPSEIQLSRVKKMLADDIETPSRCSRLSTRKIKSAVAFTLARLKSVSKIPPNGLVIYCGSIRTAEGEEKQVTVDFEPFRPVDTSLYVCDNRFHTQPLTELLEDDSKFGFIVIDNNGSLFGTLCGNARTVLHMLSVWIPKKHGKGGSSSMRFARIRSERIRQYLQRVAELSAKLFITNDRPNVVGLILAGPASATLRLALQDGHDHSLEKLFDPRLWARLITRLDVASGGESGFEQAVELASEPIANVKRAIETKLLSTFDAAQDAESPEWQSACHVQMVARL